MDSKKAAFQLLWHEITITGDDAFDYLSRQCTNNLQSLNDHNFQLNTLLDANGLIESYFLIIKKEQGLHLFTPTRFAQQTINRLKKYIVIEDVQVQEKKSQCLSFFTPEKNLLKRRIGVFWNAVFELDLECSKINSEDDSLVLLGFQEELIGKRLPQTLLVDCAYDPSKGCFPGQEPVSKILNNRGSAYFPTLLKTDRKFGDQEIIYNKQKVAQVLGHFNFNEDLYYQVELLRNFRVKEKTWLFNEQNFTVYHYPLLFKTASEFIEQSYSEATNLSLKQEKLDQALELLKRVLLLDPKHQDALEVIGVLYANKQDFKTAIKYMKDLSTINPTSIMAQTNLSLYHMKLGNIEQAEHHQAEATFLSFKNQGQKSPEEENSQKIEMFQKVLQIDPHDSLANFGLGKIYFEKKQFVQAIEHLNKVIKTDPNYSVAYLILGKSYLKEKKQAKAQEVFHQGIPIATKNGDLMPANEMEYLLKESLAN